MRRRRVGAAGLLLTVLIITGAWIAAVRAGDHTPLSPGGSPRNQAAALLDTSANPAEDSHPAFTRVQSKSLLLPVASSQATVIAYHSLDDELAVPLTPIGKRADGGLTARGASTPVNTESGISYYVFGSQGRSTPETAAVDIGAPTGAPVTSPVSGTVTGIKQYKLFGKYDDYQIDIRPQGLSDVIVSLLLVADPRVNIGESVQAGKTVLGTVRAPVPELAQRLTPLTGDEGSHVHLQVTKSPSPIE